MVGQAQIIPNHVTRPEWFQPQPELTTGKECPYRKEVFPPKKGEKNPRQKMEDFYHIYTLFLQRKKLNLERLLHFPKNTQEVNWDSNPVLSDCGVSVPLPFC